MRRVGLGVVGLGVTVWLLATAALAEEVHVSAQVDKTTVELGTSVTLTITIEGDFAKAKLEPVAFPKVFAVVAQSQASNVSLRVGALKRSVSLVYVLVPQEAGTFQLGPFHILHEGKALLTDPIEVVVTKPTLPPRLEETPRYTL